MMRLSGLGWIAASMLSLAASADSIRVGDKIYDDVYVTFAGGRYEIKLPDTGALITVPVGTDAKLLSTSSPEERDKLLEEWERKQKNYKLRISTVTTSPSTDSVEDVKEVSETKRLTSASLAERKRFKLNAEFDTQLLLWAQIPPEYREEIAEPIASSAQESLEMNIARAEIFETARAENNAVIEAESKVIAKQRKEAGEALKARQNLIERDRQAAASEANKAYRESGASWAEYMRNSYDRNLAIGFGNDSYNMMRATQWDREHTRRSNWAEGRANEAMVEHNRNVAAITNDAKRVQREQRIAEAASTERIQQMEAANRRAIGSQTLLRFQSEDGLIRARNELQKLYRLEDVLAQGYVPASRFTLLHEAQLQDASGTIEFTVRTDARLWRIMWAVAGEAQGSKLLKVSVVDEATGKAVAGSTDDVAPYERFLLIEKQGSFTVSLKGATDSHAFIVAEEWVE